MLKRAAKQTHRNLLESLRRQVPALSEVLAAELQGPRGPDADAEQETRALAYAAVLADALEQHLDGDLVLVLDDLHELNPGEIGRAHV